MTTSYLGFYWYSKAWYARGGSLGDGVVDEIMVGSYCKYDDVGCKFEFAFRWYGLDSALPSPCLEMRGDAWVALCDPEFAGLMRVLPDLATRRVQPAAMAELLLGLGFKDITKYTRES